MKQKARVKWIYKGDSNTWYFQSMVNRRRIKDEIIGVELLGQWWEEPRKVKYVVKDFFEKRLTES